MAEGGEKAVNARVLIGGFLLVGVLIITGMIYHLGWNVTWNFLNVPPMSTCFGDLQTIAGAKDSLSAGFDPLISNPNDILGGRSMNYPRVWLFLPYLGFSKVHVPFLGCFFLALFLLSVVLICPDRMKAWQLVYVMLFLLSPAVLLGIERGQTDLFIFFLVVMAVLAYQANQTCLFTLIVLLGFSLKLYPVFALIGLFSPSKRLAPSVSEVEKKSNRFRWLWLLLALLYVLGYVVLTWSDLLLIRKATPMGYYRSYGVLTWCLAAKRYLPDGFAALKMVAYGAIACLSVAICVNAGLTPGKGHVSDIGNSTATPAFIVGASVYCGTFLLGSNYDYRQLFILLVLPNLFVWAWNSKCAIRRLACVALACVMMMAWHTVIPEIFPLSKTSHAMALILGISASWILYGALLWLMVRSLQTDKRYETVFVQAFRKMKAKTMAARV